MAEMLEEVKLREFEVGLLTSGGGSTVQDEDEARTLAVSLRPTLLQQLHQHRGKRGKVHCTKHEITGRQKQSVSFILKF